MKVSIITVAYNSRSTIEDTIRSVLSQKHQDIEYIIIDGKSTDGTQEVIEKYRNQISCYISEKDKGIYDAMNKGLKLATGDIVGIINSDDLLENEFILSAIAKEFLQDPDLDIVYGNLVYVSTNDINCIKRVWKSTPYYHRYFEDGHVPPHPTLYLKRDIYEKVGYFDQRYKLAADYEFMLRLFKKFDVKSKYLNTIIVRMRLGGATNKNWRNILNGNKEIWRSWSNNGLNIPFLLMPIRLIKRLSQFI